MDSLNLTYNSSDTPHGLLLMYSTLIDTIDFNNLEAIIYYFKNSNNENRTKVWIDNSGNLQLNQSYSKLSHFVLAHEDIFRFDQIENLGTNQVYMLLNQTVLPSEQYYSEFQTKIDKEYVLLRPDPDYDEKQRQRWCSRNFIDCPHYDWEGTCTYQESQMNHISTWCIKGSVGGCQGKMAHSLLLNNNTPLDSTVLPRMYEIKDNVLLNDVKYEYLIDDFYYLSSIIAEDMTLSIALDIRDLSNTNFLDVFKNYNNPTYADSILITSVNKPIILDICNASKNLTTDTRATNIINNTISLANTYENKTITYIKNN